MEADLKPVVIVRRDLGPTLAGLCRRRPRRYRAVVNSRLLEDNPLHLEAVIHELLHATYPKLSERAVGQGARKMAAAMISDGWLRG